MPLPLRFAEMSRQPARTSLVSGLFRFHVRNPFNPCNPRSPFCLPLLARPDRFVLMQITKMVGSHCDDTRTAFRTEPPLNQEVLDCAVTSFFPAGLGDMLSTKDGLLVARTVGIPTSVGQDYARYLTSAEMTVRKQRATDG